jgi:hypothetical protein
MALPVAWGINVALSIPLSQAEAEIQVPMKHLGGHDEQLGLSMPEAVAVDNAASELVLQLLSLGSSAWQPFSPTLTQNRRAAGPFKARAVGIACSSGKFHIFHIGLMMFEKNWAAAEQGQAA